MRSLPLYISRDHRPDWLIALELGRVLDGQPPEHLICVDEDAAFVLDGPGGEIVGFTVTELRAFDPSAHEELWRGPRFDAPLFGLRAAHAGEIVLATQAELPDESTTNRCYFSMAINAEDPEEAAGLWRSCLQCGDSMAHQGLGYTLLDLGDMRGAYRHLRAYAEAAPWNAWAWCWLGRACIELGEREEARDALVRAVALEAAGGMETDAEDLLTTLERSTQ